MTASQHHFLWAHQVQDH
jgi:hypothetical protein